MKSLPLSFSLSVVSYFLSSFSLLTLTSPSLLSQIFTLNLLHKSFVLSHKSFVGLYTADAKHRLQNSRRSNVSLARFSPFVSRLSSFGGWALGSPSLTPPFVHSHRSYPFLSRISSRTTTFLLPSSSTRSRIRDLVFVIFFGFFYIVPLWFLVFYIVPQLL